MSHVKSIITCFSQHAVYCSLNIKLTDKQPEQNFTFLIASVLFFFFFTCLYSNPDVLLGNVLLSGLWITNTNHDSDFRFCIIIKKLI